MATSGAVIISNKRDWTTNHVIDWLKYYNYNFTFQGKIDYENSNITIRLDQVSEKTYVKVEDKLIDKNIMFWLRKSPKFIESKHFSGIKDTLVTTFIKAEKKAFFRFYFSAIRNFMPHLGSNLQYNTPMEVNKLESLIIARNVGLNIPRSIISNNRDEISEFLSLVNNAIIKPLSESTMMPGSTSIFTMHSKLFDKALLKDLAQNTFPIFLQEYIPKQFEIRVFVINKKYYSAAIFSQNDEQTKIDYRKYNDENPNRMVPFTLPFVIESKLNELMCILGLNTGSIDLIFTPGGEYYFLEINPVGQFGGVSYNCNFFIENIVANYLVHG